MDRGYRRETAMMRARVGDPGAWPKAWASCPCMPSKPTWICARARGGSITPGLWSPMLLFGASGTAWRVVGEARFRGIPGALPAEDGLEGGRETSNEHHIRSASSRWAGHVALVPDIARPRCGHARSGGARTAPTYPAGQRPPPRSTACPTPRFYSCYAAVMVMVRSSSLARRRSSRAQAAAYAGLSWGSWSACGSTGWTSCISGSRSRSRRPRSTGASPGAAQDRGRPADRDPAGRGRRRPGRAPGRLQLARPGRAGVHLRRGWAAPPQQLQPADMAASHPSGRRGGALVPRPAAHLGHPVHRRRGEHARVDGPDGALLLGGRPALPARDGRAGRCHRGRLGRADKGRIGARGAPTVGTEWHAGGTNRAIRQGQAAPLKRRAGR
jgi:hypothetical protein